MAGAAKDEGSRDPAWALAAIATALMATQSASGILFPSVYRDEGFALDAWRVNDPVSLVLAVPTACAALWWARSGSTRGSLVLLGGMQYALYNYAFYLFGAALNAHFLLYVAAFVCSGLALIAGFVSLDARAVAASIRPRAPLRAVAIYMALWAAVLGVAWVAQALVFAIGGQLPALGEEPFRLIAALDLALVVTPAALSAGWLWRRRAWGVVLAIVLNVKGVLYATLLAVGSALAGPLREGGGDGMLGLWVFFAVGSFAALVALLAALRPSERQRGDEP